MTSILVAATLPAFAMSEPDWHWWLSNAEQIRETAEAEGHTAGFFATLQVDARGLAPFQPLIDRLQALEHDPLRGTPHITFSVDLGVDEWTTDTRLAGIITGRNLIVDRAIRRGHEWIYFADSDIEAPDDILPRLLELDWPVVGGHVPTYCLSGPPAEDDWRHRIRDVGERFDGVRVHWTTAGSLMVRRDVFRRVPWRFDPDAGETDDPATQAEMARLGYPTLVRHDVLCTHHPESIAGFEHRGLDRTVYR